jgi:glutamine amidotransferase
MIALVDYGAGNLTSVRQAFAAIGAEVSIPASPADLATASGVVVPGVGHFAATRALEGDWTAAILERLGEGRPIFGICLGMQWLFEGSEEAPDCPGLGVLGGQCIRLRPGTGSEGAGSPAGTTIKIPHVGWNSLDLRVGAPIVDGVEANAQVYFTHSYAAPVTGDTVAVTEHGQRFAAIVQRGTVAGVQFHPEKSGDAGLQILRNFMELAR